MNNKKQSKDEKILYASNNYEIYSIEKNNNVDLNKLRNNKKRNINKKEIKLDIKETDELINKLKPVIIRKTINSNNEKLCKETLERKIEIRKLLLINKKESILYKIITILYKLHIKSNKLLLINKKLFINLTKILKISINYNLINELIDFISCINIINIENNILIINKKEYAITIFEQKVDEIFIDKLSEDYKKTLKLIEKQTIINQEKFELEIKKKEINIKKDYFSLNISNNNKTINERMNLILLRLKNKKLKNIERFSGKNTLIKNIEYIFEMENKKRLSLKFINEKLSIQNPLNLILSRDSIDLIIKDFNLQNKKNINKFKTIELYGEVFVELF